MNLYPVHRLLSPLFAPSRKVLTATVGVLLLSGCASVTSPTFDATAVVPEQWQGGDRALGATRILSGPHLEWWQSFGNAELDRLMMAAMNESFTLQASLERIEQARARLVSSRSTLWPQLDAGYSFSRSEQWQSGDRSHYESDRFSMSAGYEVDLWGRVRAGVRASQASLEASEFAHLSSRLSLQAELAGAYLQWLAAQDRLEYARSSLTVSEEVLRLIELQYREGSASQLELVQQQASVASQRTQIHDLENARTQIRYAIAVLTGQPPGSLVLTGHSLADLHLPLIEPEQPAELLQRRPDLLQAERQLEAANTSVVVARAALFPSLRLSASAGTVSLLTGGVSSSTLGLGANLAQPLFQAGRLRADIAAAQSGEREVLANYYQTALQAILEVENVLSDLATQDRNRELETESLALAERAYELADLRYRSGASDYLTLLDAQRSLITRRDSFVQFELSRYQSALNLYRALGGSWWTEADS